MLRSTAANIAASVCLVAIAGAVVIFVVLSGRGHTTHPALAATTTPPASRTTTTLPGLPAPPLTDTGLASLTSSVSTGTDSGSGTPTGSGPSGATGAVLSQVEARQTVVTYLNDVNEGDRNAAQNLICQALLPAWLQNINSANSDFNYVVTNARFTGSAGTSDDAGLVLHYTLTFSDNTDDAVDFTVIQQNGPKICGETRS